MQCLGVCAVIRCLCLGFFRWFSNVDNGDAPFEHWSPEMNYNKV
jgi:hypothetical protein